MTADEHLPEQVLITPFLIQAVIAAIEAVSGHGGWQLTAVGGARRNADGRCGHDADFLLSHATAAVEGLVWPLYRQLVAAGRLVAKDFGEWRKEACGCSYGAGAYDVGKSVAGDYGAGSYGAGDYARVCCGRDGAPRRASRAETTAGGGSGPWQSPALHSYKRILAGGTDASPSNRRRLCGVAQGCVQVRPPHVRKISKRTCNGNRYLRCFAGFCSVQDGKRVAEEARLRESAAGGRDSQAMQRRAIDGYDHIFGVFLTSGGKRRRLDVLLIPHACLPWALLGWSGSRGYLRMLKHAVGATRHMRLSSHGLVREEHSNFQRLPCYMVYGPKAQRMQ